MQYISYLEKRGVLQQEYSQPPTLPSPHFRWVVNIIYQFSNCPCFSISLCICALFGCISQRSCDFFSCRPPGFPPCLCDLLWYFPELLLVPVRTDSLKGDVAIGANCAHCLSRGTVRVYFLPRTLSEFLLDTFVIVLCALDTVQSDQHRVGGGRLPFVWIHLRYLTYQLSGNTIHTETHLCRSLCLLFFSFLQAIQYNYSSCLSHKQHNSKVSFC